MTEQRGYCYRYILELRYYKIGILKESIILIEPFRLKDNLN